ncbi:MAG: YvcK family protein [Planctomycetes bacterium]|nr:YvcK family protein [Planctomycetota bacterium]
MEKVLKWLRPGLRIKRWIAVIFLGILFAVIASAALIAYVNTTALDDSGGKFLVATVLGFMLSAFCLITGIYRLIKSMWELVGRRGRQEGIVDAAYKRAMMTSGPKVVAIGGGTGLSVVLAGLRQRAGYVTAVVSMADDGGSSGKLRQELGLQPPGDLRKCLIALADEEPQMQELLDYRFPENELGGHNFGNLFLTVLARIRGDFGAGVREANRILSVRGQVLPSTLDRIFLVAEHEDGTKTTGQALIAKTEKRIKRLELKPAPEPVAEDIKKALEEADLIVLGPGSLYTSVLPNLLIEGMAEALAKSKAKKVFVSNIMTYEGETRGFDLPDFLNAIDVHTLPHRVYDHVLVQAGQIGMPSSDAGGSIHAQGSDGKTWVVNEKTARVVQYDPKAFAHAPFKIVAADVVNPAYPIRHDSGKLCKALLELLKESA